MQGLAGQTRVVAAMRLAIGDPDAGSPWLLAALAENLMFGSVTVHAAQRMLISVNVSLYLHHARLQRTVTLGSPRGVLGCHLLLSGPLERFGPLLHVQRMVTVPPSYQPMSPDLLHNLWNGLLAGPTEPPVAASDIDGMHGL